MRVSLTISVYLVAGDKTPVNLEANVGGSVTIRCKYPTAEKGKTKHFCKEDNNSNCKNVVSIHLSNYTRLDRFSLTDNKQQGLYNVTLSKLTREDSGRYRCSTLNATGSTMCLLEVHLNVMLDNNTGGEISASPALQDTQAPVRSWTTSSTTNQTKPHVDQDFIVGVVVCAALLVIVVGLFILYRHKCNRKQGRSSEQEGIDGNHLYDEMQLQAPLTNAGNTLLSVYATASLPTEQILYASIAFQGETGSILTESNLLPETNSAWCDDSSRIQGTAPPAGQTLYSTVTAREP
ncbi:CMRF35-like molecule 8 [Aulostomus maculatus]